MGIFGADVADYDGDGDLDLMVSVLTRGEEADWVMGQSGWSNETGAALNLSLMFFTADEDGEIYRVSVLPAAAQIDGSSFGELGWYLLEWEGKRYITGWCSLEDVTTYGPNLSDTWHIAADGAFVHDYIGGALTWGQATYQGDLNAELGTENTELPKYLTGRELAKLSISWPDANGVSTFQSEDLTHLEALLHGDRAAAMEQLKREEEDWRQADREAYAAWLDGQAQIEQNAAPMRSLAERISAESGVILEQTDEGWDDGVYSLSLKAPGGTTLLLWTGANPGELGCFSLDSPTWKMTEEFAALKDAFLGMEEFGFDAGAVQRYLGLQNGNYQNETLGKGIEITMMGVASYFMRVTFLPNPE